jgi:H+/Cl- antiporter ClcA
LAGLASTVFLITLKWATDSRERIPVLLFGLPVIGFVIGWVYHQFGREAARGHNLILDEIHDPKNVVPVRMAPLVLGGTILTHLFGGSAGREGTAVQMGASLSDQLSLFFKVEPEERKILLTCGAGAGFGAAIGAPWAGVIFGMEVIHVGRLRLYAWFECLIASFIAYYTTIVLNAPHTHYPSIAIPGFSFKLLLIVTIAGALFGLAAKGFIYLTHVVEHFQLKWISSPPLRPVVGGLLLVALYYLEGSFKYEGLGLRYIEQALLNMVSFREPALKTFFTSLTIGSGYKGGEFIPLVFIGTTLGSALGMFFPAFFQVLAGVGFAAVFAGAANTPIACSLMAMEIFGAKLGLYAFVGCWMSYLFSGHQGIYKSQRYAGKKHHRLLKLLRLHKDL